jgi:eukaryotic-like serine/threonine-protein kinase
MSEFKICPTCGFEFPAATHRQCPRCPMSTQADDPRNRFSHVDHATILGIIEADMGPVQSIFLRDTDDGVEPPLIQSNSTNEADDSIRYSIDGLIARGGMGTVYKGHDPDLGRRVAIKVLRTDLHDKPTMIRRFVEEAQIGGQLQHPGIVPIYEMGTFADRRPFFSMKLVKGHTLAALLESRKDPASELPRFLGIFEQIAQTMAYVHARGVIHRDLKPSNVMVGAFGEVQVMDWGLAKVLPGGTTSDDQTLGGSPPGSVLHTVRSNSHDDASVAGTVLGTPSYMAPEQARGQMELIDERTDVFGLGSILCEILTGKPALIGQSHREILMLTARGDLTKTFKRLDASGADQKLIDLTRRCLHPEPNQRPNHAGEVSSAITAYLTDVQERVRNAELERVKAEAMAVEERKRRRVSLALAASIMATLLIGGGGWVWTSHQHQTRVANTALRVERALGEVKTALVQAENPGDLTFWNKASDSLRIAEVALGDTPVDPQLRDRVNEARLKIDKGIKAAESQAEQSERDQNLLRRFEEVRALNAKKGPDAADSRAEGYLKVFKDEGFDFNAASTPDAGKLFAGRDIAVEIAAALDDWAIAAYENVRFGTESSRRLLKIAQIADPDPWRNRLRDAISASDVDELRKLALTDKDELKKQPTPTLVLLGEGLSKFNEFKLATKVLTDAQRRRPDDYWINYTLGTVLAASDPKKYDEAIRYLSNAISVRPNSGLTHFKLSEVLDKAGRKEESLIELETAINLWPEYKYFAQSMALRLQSQQQLDKASAVLRGAVDANPEDPQLRFNLGDIYYDKLFSFEDAIQCFRKATELKPDMALAHTHLGRSLSRLGHFEEAITEQRRGVGLGPTETETHEYYGVSLRSVDLMEQSASHLRMAIRLLPGNQSAHHYLGNTLDDLGLMDEAISEYQLALRRRVRDGTRHDLFKALTSIGELSEAEEVVKNAEKKVPDRVIGKHLRGSLLLAGGEPTAALDLLDQVDKEKPEGYRALEALNEERRLAIRYEELVGKLDEVVNGQNPKLSPDVQIALADIALRRRLFLVARELYGKAITAQETLVSDPKSGLRFAAARAAIQAAFVPVNAANKDDLLEQGLTWLRAELEAKKTALLQKDLSPKDRNMLIKELRIWIRHRDLAEVRDPLLSKNVPDVQINLWKGFWADVKAVIDNSTPSKNYDESVETLKLAREAVRQFPSSGSARVGLSFLLVLQGAVDEALDIISDAAKLTSEGQEVYSMLASKLQKFGRQKDGIEVLLRAIKNNPGQKIWHDRLSQAVAEGNDEAPVIFRQALKFDPNSASAHVNLAKSLGCGDMESALALLKDAAAIDGDSAGEAIRLLGAIQRGLGRYDDAVATYKKIGEVVRNSPEEVESAKQEVARTEQFKALDSQLKQPTTPAIKLQFPNQLREFIRSCLDAHRFDKATQAWAAMLAANPALGKDRNKSTLYYGARMALKAGCGKQQNVIKADQKTLRNQALNWLKEDLAHWAKLLDQGVPESRETTIRWLNDWKRNPDLAAIRDEEALQKFPADEQSKWRALWQDVESLLKNARNDGWGGRFQPVTDEQLSSKIPSSFLFWENDPPLQPGHRRWTRKGNEIFVGQDAKGIEFESKILGRTTLFEVEGTVFERVGDENLHYFIPDRGFEYTAVRKRRLEKPNEWLEFGILESVENQP